MTLNTAAPREVSIKVSRAERLIRVKLSGRPPQESIVMMLNMLNTTVEQNSSLSVLIDETELDPRFVGPGDMERFVAAWRGGRALRSTNLAVFVSNGAMFGLNRQFEALTDGHEGMSVFSNRVQAEAWLREQPNRHPSPRRDLEPVSSMLTV